MCGVCLEDSRLNRDATSLTRPSLSRSTSQTDLTSPSELTSGKTLDEMGAKTPEEGAKVLIHLATADVPSSGWYFGSDLQRSPLDRYRGPGEPPYTGE